MIGVSLRSTTLFASLRPAGLRTCAFSSGRAAVLALGIAFAFLPAPLLAQRILGAGSDGVVLPRGGFRIGIGGESTVQRDRWRDGALEGLGGSVTTDAFGPLQFSMLAPVEQVIRSLGVAGFDASLGSARLETRQRAFVTPLAVEYGLFEWLTVSARASLVRTRAESQFRIRTDSGRATLGINPIFAGSSVGAQNAATIGAYASASTNLTARRDACLANAGAYPECPTILTEIASVNALSSRTGAFAQGLLTVYGGGVVRGQRYVPFAGSAADSALLARVDSLRTALLRYGVTDVTAFTGLPLGAQVPLVGEDIDRLVRDSTDGFGARALNDAALTQIGDVHLGALIRLHDSFAKRDRSRFALDARGWRQSLLLEARLGTSHREAPDAFADQGTGAGTSALTVRSITDIVVNGRFWTTLAIGYTQPFAKDFRVRVPSSADNEWLEWEREMLVPITPGGEIDIAFSPRWHLNDYVALGGQWIWRSAAADEYAVDLPSVSVGGTLMLLSPAVLEARSKTNEQRFGFSATYSTLAARARGVPGLSFDVTYLHQQSIASSSGIVPKQWEDRLMIRYYTRFFAR